MERLTDKNTRYCEKENAEMHKEMLSKVFENFERFGKMENKLRKFEDLLENADSIKIIKRNGVASLHIDMILDDETYPIAEQLFGKEKVIDFDK